MKIEGFFFFHFSLKPHVVNPHLNSLVKMIQMKGHVCLYEELTKKYP